MSESQNPTVAELKVPVTFSREAEFAYIQTLSSHGAYLLTCPPGFGMTTVAKTLVTMFDYHENPIKSPHLPEKRASQFLVFAYHLSEFEFIDQRRGRQEAAETGKTLRAWLVGRTKVLLLKYQIVLGVTETMQILRDINSRADDHTYALRKALDFIHTRQRKVVIVLCDFDHFLLVYWANLHSSRNFRHSAIIVSEVMGEYYSCIGSLLEQKRSLDRVFVLGCSNGNRLLLAGIPGLIDISRQAELSNLFGINLDEAAVLHAKVCPDHFWSSRLYISLESRPSRRVRLWDGSLGETRYPIYSIIKLFITQGELHESQQRMAPEPRVLPELLNAASRLLDQVRNGFLIRNKLMREDFFTVKGLTPVDMLGLFSSNEISETRAYSILLGIGVLTDDEPMVWNNINGSLRSFRVSAHAFRTKLSKPSPFTSLTLSRIWNSYFSRLTPEAKKISSEETFRNTLGLLLEHFSEVVFLELPLCHGAKRADILAIKDNVYYLLELKYISFNLLVKTRDVYTFAHFASLSPQLLAEMSYYTKFDPNSDSDVPLPKLKAFKIDDLCRSGDRQLRGYMSHAENGEFSDFQYGQVYQLDRGRSPRPGQLKVDRSQTWPMIIRGMTATCVAGAGFIFRDVLDGDGELLQYTTNVHFTFNTERPYVGDIHSVVPM